MRLSAERRSGISEQAYGWISNIQRFSLHDGPGIRSIIFFKGCQMRCAWCANPEGQTAEQDVFFHADRCLHCGNCADLCPTGLHSMNQHVHALAVNYVKSVVLPPRSILSENMLAHKTHLKGSWLMKSGFASPEAV